MNRPGESHQTNPQHIAALGVEEPAQSELSPIIVELPNPLNHHLAAGFFALKVKCHV